MDNNNGYVLKRNTDYGYEIYLVSNEERIKLEGKDKIIMNRVLKKIPYRETKNGDYKYTNLELIKLYFKKEELLFSQKQKKVNREKSKKILPKFILATALIASITAGAYQLHSNNQNQNKEEQSIVTIHPTIVPNIEDKEEVEYNQTEEKIPQTIDFIEKEPNVFYYEFETPGDEKAYQNASQYMDVFKKYEKIYGIDAKLLCAIAAQESSGKHVSYSQNGHATGLMQIEDIWADAEFRVFNFEKNDYETIKVDYSKIGNLDYNVKMGAAIFRWTVDDCKKNYPYLTENERLALYTQCYNYGAGFTNQAIKNAENIPNGTWMDGREYIRAGDKRYFEHVLSRIPNNEIITIYSSDGNNLETVLVNTALEKTPSRAH